MRKTIFVENRMYVSVQFGEGTKVFIIPFRMRTGTFFVFFLSFFFLVPGCYGIWMEGVPGELVAAMTARTTTAGPRRCSSLSPRHREWPPLRHVRG